MPSPVVVVARHGYSKPGENILNFSQGDLMEVLEETNAKWWAARMLRDEDIAGYIPASYVKLADTDLVASATSSRSTPPPETRRSCSGSIRQRLHIFENNSVPSYSPQPPRNDWSRSTLPAKSSYCISTQSSPARSATLARDIPETVVDMDNEEVSNCIDGPPERSPSPRMLINPVGALTKELKFEQKRGITLGRPELQKVFDGGRSAGGHVSPGISRAKSDKQQNGPDTKSELGKALQKQTAKIGQKERADEDEAKKPEFMRMKLKTVAA